jgi:hypothetical protein
MQGVVVAAMGWLKNMLPKVPERYEDIVVPGTRRLGWFQRVRLISFLVGHPEEAERYARDFETDMINYVGRNCYAEYVADPRKKMKELRKKARELRKEIRAERRKHPGLLALVNVQKRTIESYTGMGEKG